MRNREVERLGVTFCLVSHGVDNSAFERGLQLWRAQGQSTSDGDGSPFKKRVSGRKGKDGRKGKGRKGKGPTPA